MIQAEPQASRWLTCRALRCCDGLEAKLAGAQLADLAGRLPGAVPGSALMGCAARRALHDARHEGGCFRVLAWFSERD